MTSSGDYTQAIEYSQLFVAERNTKLLNSIDKRTVGPRAGESRSEARGNISFEGPIGSENTSRGGGGGSPLRLAQRAPYHTLGPLFIPWGPG